MVRESEQGGWGCFGSSIEWTGSWIHGSESLRIQIQQHFKKLKNVYKNKFEIMDVETKLFCIAH